MSPEQPAQPAPTARLITALLAGLVVLLAARSAWLADDFYISLRTVWNLHNGFGLEWNPGERVQVFTHPLWFLLLSATTGITGLYQLGTWATALACTAGCVVIVRRTLGPERPVTAIALAALALSRGFVDFSTSGLENPLSHLLMAAYLAVLWREGDPSRRVLHAGLLGGALLLNRLDHALLVVPLSLPLLLEAHRARGFRALLALLPGAALVAAWLGFAWAYFGTPLPNSFAAKVGGTVPAADRAAQALVYFADALDRDPVGFAALLVGVVAALRTRAAWGIALAAAILLHVAYLFRVGSDFMSMRFLTVPLLVAVMGAARAGRDLRLPHLGPMVPLLIVMGAGAALPTFRSNAMDAVAFAETTKMYGNKDLGDERLGFLREHSLARANRHQLLDRYLRPPAEESPRTLRVTNGVGLPGFRAGRAGIVIDMLGVTDPFIAHLPVIDGSHWKPGHGIRYVRRDYIRSRVFGENLMRDPAEAALLAWIDARHRSAPAAPEPTTDQWARIRARNAAMDWALAAQMQSDMALLFAAGDAGVAPLAFAEPSRGVAFLFREPAARGAFAGRATPAFELTVTRWLDGEGLPAEVTREAIRTDADGVFAIPAADIAFDELRIEAAGDWRLESFAPAR